MYIVYKNCMFGVGRLGLHLILWRVGFGISFAPLFIAFYNKNVVNTYTYKNGFVHLILNNMGTHHLMDLIKVSSFSINQYLY